MPGYFKGVRCQVSGVRKKRTDDIGQMTEEFEFGLRPLRAVGSLYELEAIGPMPTPRREGGKK
jgi:hypothetical protein